MAPTALRAVVVAAALALAALGASPSDPRLHSRRWLFPAVLPVAALDDGVGRTPAMGWNSWNLFDCDVNETIVRSVADKIVASGLAELGYNYINIDDCWQIDRNPDGSIVVDKDRFPSGIPALSDYIHSKGLKFGLYSSAGDYTCQRRPGGLGHEVIDAQTYAAWNVDYLKYDNCHNRGESDEEGTRSRYGAMRDALNATGRHMYYSICNWGEANIWEFGQELGHSWRTSGDICDKWTGVNDWGAECSIPFLMDLNAPIANYSAPGGFNDMDMLEVGNGGMTTAEYRTHFAVWAALKSVLLLGNDVTVMSAADFAIISNPEVIAVNQDPLGASAVRVAEAAGAGKGADVWAGPLDGGDRVVLVVNRRDSHLNHVLLLDEKVLGPGAGNKWLLARDLWKRRDIGIFNGHIYLSHIEPHDTVILRLSSVARSDTPLALKFLSAVLLVALLVVVLAALVRSVQL
ncbi:hypothetical protein HK405_006888, partial [Cladochytrium tenue]